MISANKKNKVHSESKSLREETQKPIVLQDSIVKEQPISSPQEGEARTQSGGDISLPPIDKAD